MEGIKTPDERNGGGEAPVAYLRPLGLDGKIRSTIIEWLGLMYDERLGDTSNPDYIGPIELDKIVSSLGALFQEYPRYPREAAEPTQATINVVLYCPVCRHPHVDAPEPDKGWTNPPHKSHLCHYCGCIWRPADVATNGVDPSGIRTRGKLDTWPRVENSQVERVGKNEVDKQSEGG